MSERLVIKLKSSWVTSSWGDTVGSGCIHPVLEVARTMRALGWSYVTLQAYPPAARFPYVLIFHRELET